MYSRYWLVWRCWPCRSPLSPGITTIGTIPDLTPGTIMAGTMAGLNTSGVIGTSGGTTIGTTIIWSGPTRGTATAGSRIAVMGTFPDPGQMLIVHRVLTRRR